MSPSAWRNHAPPKIIARSIAAFHRLNTIVCMGTYAKGSNEPLPAAATAKEIELGRKEAERLEKDPRVKLLDGSKDPAAKALLEKLNTMATTLGKVSARPKIVYKIKVIEDKSINAFTLPNGHIYLTRGLIDFATSDDEIAGVIAHEIGHNARMHVIRGEAKNKPLQWVGIAAMLAMIKGGDSGADIARMTPYVLTGIANAYSIAYEKEADAAAIEQLAQTSYNPSALVTFMNRLGAEEKRRPQVELGIYQTHPASPERAQAALDAIAKAGLSYTPRAVTGAMQATVAEKEGRVQVLWGETILIQFAPATTESSTQTASVATLSNKRRATQITARINSLLRSNLRLYEISVQTNGNDAVLVARGQELARATAAEAKLQGVTPVALAQTWKNNLQRIFWKENLNGAM
jgi:predicted Zn-dependent protease